MDDLLRATLEVEDPADEVVARSRHRLQNHIRGGRPRHGKRIAWLSAGVAVTAAAVAIAVLPGAPAPHSARETATGKEILLAAAAVAARTHDGSGAHWHVTIDVTNDTYDYWTALDGRWWFSSARCRPSPRHCGRGSPRRSCTATPAAARARSTPRTARWRPSTR